MFLKRCIYFIFIIIKKLVLCGSREFKIVVNFNFLYIWFIIVLLLKVDINIYEVFGYVMFMSL